MAEGFDELRRDISSFLLSLRQSIDRPFRGKPPTANVERERYMRTIMMVEEARVRFNSYTRYREEPTAADWTAARNELLAFTRAFLHADDIDTDVYDRRFRFSPMMSRDRDNPSPFMQRFNPERENRVAVAEANPVSVAEALIWFRTYLEDTRIEFNPVEGDLSFGDLERIVPRQQVAPVQFEVKDNRIVVTSRSPRSADADKANIESALEHIKGSGEQLVNNLEKSNCDKRLLESIRELQSQLHSDGNIVRIGLTNMACGMMSSQFQTELPDAIAAMLNAYSASISLYVAQFPEWDQFTQKAAAIDLDEDDIAEVDIAAGELINVLSANPDLADPEVPKTIAFVRQFLTFPGASSKRAAFAMVRTIENLVSSILRHSVNFFSKTAEKMVDGGSTLASKVIIGLLGIALMGASGIGPAAIRAGAPWVKQAADIVQKHIDKAE